MLYILSSIRQGGFIQMGEHLNQLPHHGFSILRQMAEQPNGRGWRGPDICLDLQRFNEKQQFFQPFFFAHWREVPSSSVFGKRCAWEHCERSDGDGFLMQAIEHLCSVQRVLVAETAVCDTIEEGGSIENPRFFETAAFAANVSGGDAFANEGQRGVIATFLTNVKLGYAKRT